MADNSQTTTEAVPTMDTLQDWHVGRMSDGLNEVRFVLTSNEEARAWAVWIANHDQ